MKKIFFLILLMPFFLTAQYTLIPDTCFEQALLDQNIDSDNTLNGRVLTSDINTITNLQIGSDPFSCNINDLTGIEDFTLLEVLAVDDNSITNIDMSHNLQLKQLYCKNNAITQLNVSQNVLLEGLHCGYNDLNAIDVSSNINLLRFNFRYNNLTSIDVSSNINLISLFCEDNQLSNLDISNNLLLQSLGIKANQIPNININMLNQLESINCISTPITSLNTSNNQLLNWLWCQNSQISNIDLSNNPQLNWLWCQNTQLTTLDISNNPLLDKFNCSNNNLTFLNVQNGNNTALTGTYTNGGPIIPRFIADNNPNLTCILVDDANYSTANWTVVDPASTFVETQNDCDALAVEPFNIGDFSIYPNPTKNYFSIESNFDINTLKIYDVLGKLVKSFTASNIYNITDLNKGVYTIQITSIVNTRYFSKLLIE